MRFLDDKEEVINFEMTPYGKHLLSKGQYRPVYYAFHDDDILYDPEFAGFTPVTVTRTNSKQDSTLHRATTIFGHGQEKDGEFFSKDRRKRFCID